MSVYSKVIPDPNPNPGPKVKKEKVQYVTQLY